MAFKKAVRENIWTKICLIGASGGGKSYSGLRLGTGIASAMSKKTGKECRVAGIDVEKKRLLYYAKEFDFDHDLLNDITPEGYIKKIQEAIDAGYQVILVDGITPEWKKCLEIHSKIPGNSYTAWDKVTPRHDAFMEYLLECPAHVIATIRGKDRYVLEEVDGKKVPKKLNLGYVQREDTEYQFTLSFNIDKDSHIADTLKDNTHLFEDENRVLTEVDGKKIFEWANDGDIETKIKELEKDKEEVNAKIQQNAEKVAKEIVEEQNKKRTDSKMTFDQLKTKTTELCQTKTKEFGRDAVVNIINDKLQGKKLNETKADNYEEVMELFEALSEMTKEAN
jgi:hypothetical protein